MAQRILIVEDDASIAQACKKALATEGYEVATAGSGEEAIDILKNRQFQLLITDIHMPGMSGMELLRLVKAKLADCDVIIITAYATVDTAIEALHLGVYDYIRKSFSIEELRNKVNECMQARQEKELLEKEKEQDILTLYQVSKFCSVSLTTVNNWLEQGLIPSAQATSRNKRIRRADLFVFLKKYKVPNILMSFDE